MRRVVLIAYIICNFFFANMSLAKDESKLNAASMQVKSLIQSYTTRLFPNHDPFSHIFSLDSGKVLFERMNIRYTSKTEFEPSPLSKINFALKSFTASETALDQALVNEVIKDAEDLLAKARIPQVELQSNLLALQFLAHYLQRFDPISESEGIKEQSEEDKKKDEEAKKEENKQKQKPQYPETSDKYKPNTKDTEKDKEKGSKEDQFVVAEVNFETPYFGNRFYSELVRGARYPFQESTLPGLVQKPSQAKDIRTQMIVHTFGKKQLRLFLPPFYKPLQPTDPRVHVINNGKGSYELKLDVDMEEVAIPLSDSISEIVQAPVLEVYTRPIGFKVNEWPSLIQTTLFKTFKPDEDHSKNAVQLAQTIAAHIASNYLYSVGPRPETDPIKALESGAFQCDMAAYAMVGLLRDVYKIPSRVVGGFRAKKKGKASKNSYLVMPGEGHAWVEIYNEGRWIPFDPTPIKKDKKDKDSKDGEKDEYSDRDLSNPMLDPPEDEKDSKPSGDAGEGKGSSEGEPQTKEDQLRKDTETRLKELGEDAKKEGEQGKKEDSESAMDLNELAAKLELGSLELEPHPDRNPLRERAMRVLLQLILDPNNKGSVTLDLLNKAKSVFRNVQDAKVQEVYNEALRIHESEHENLASWIRYTDLMIKSRDLASTYKDIYKAKKATELFTSVLDDEADRMIATSLIKVLTKIQSEIFSLAHIDSQEIASVLAFYNSLPALVRTYLDRQYNLKSVGPNAPTKEIARLMWEGKLNDLRLLASLYPVTDFIMNSIPRPEFEEVHSWQRDLRRPSGHDLMPLQRFGELARALLLQPGLSIDDNIRDNTAFVMTRRQRLLHPTGHGIDDAEKITIVLYDISGSMSGDPAHFQAGLISAFTARALSDVSGSGHHRHRILLIPFDDKTGEPTRVTNTEEALNVIHNYASKLAKSGGGTNIQNAMIQALALIADAEKRAGEPLAAANIVLMTDGQANVDLDELSKARNAIDRSTPVQALFLAIGTTNNDLIKFAMNSRSIGFENGFYSEFSSELMSQYLRNAASPELKIDNSVLYTEHTASSLGNNVSYLLDEANRLAIILSERVKTLNKPTKAPLQHHQDFETTSWKNLKHDRPLAHHIERFRVFAKSAIFKNRFILDKICDDLMLHFETLTGVPLSEFDDTEQEQLRHLLKFAAGLEK